MASGSSPSFDDSGASIILPAWASELPREWGWHQLDEVCTEIVDCPHSTPEVVDDGPYLMARTTDVLGGVFRAHEAKRVSETSYRERIRRAEPQVGDLLYSREGTYFGIAAEVPPDTNVCLGQRMVLLRPDPEKAEARFVRHWLNSPRIQSYINGHRDGSVAERLNLPTIRHLPICLPSLPEQRAIAHILGTLDDKIELDRQMSETLEAMARALFKSWFVDFDPVRAKAEGLDTGLPKEIAGLFPDRFVDSELGEIPEGWEIGVFGHVVDFLRDTTNPLSSPDTIFHHFSIPAFDEGQQPRTELGAEIKSLKSRVVAGATLLSKLNPEIDRVWLADVDAKTPAVCSTEFLVLIAKPPFSRSYVYCLARSRGFRQELEGLVTGTSKSHQRVHATAVQSLSVVLPPKAVTGLFDQLAGSLLDRILRCRAESQTLAGLRNSLLPKLISGDLRVKDVYAQAQKAAS